MLILFADSNVFIEALFVENSAASVVLELVAQGSFDLATCQQVINDVEKAILNKLTFSQDSLNMIIKSWEEYKEKTRVIIIKDPSESLVERTYHDYIGIMKHKADIPILAAAITMEPRPVAILSGNREHFNDNVSKRCGVYIGSCQEFIELLSQR